ncbi:MAG: beta-propeller domain-containing protein [Candidatus Thermoplasmatota archaeon]
MLRQTLLTLTLLLPLSGCMGGGPAATVTLFDLRGTIPDDPSPLPVPSCGVLLDALNQRALDEARAALQQSIEHGGWYGSHGDVAVDFAMADSETSAMAATSSGAPGGSAAPGLGRQVTGTNNQEGAADEGDLLKTDGTWTYVLTTDGALHILRHDAIGDVERVARVVLGESPSWGAGHLLLEPRDSSDPTDDRLVIVLPNAAPDAYGLSILAPAMRDRASYGMTRILVLGLAGRTAPVVESDTFIEGQATGVRLVGGVAHVVVQRWSGDLGLQTWAEPDEADMLVHGMVQSRIGTVSESAMKDLRRQAALKADAANQQRADELTLRDHLPLVLTSTEGTASPEPLGEAQCQDVLATPGPTGRSVSTIFSIDVVGDLATSTVQVLGASATVYASGEALVLAAPTADAWWATAQTGLQETTDLHWFDLDGLDVTHRASGRVVGSVLDSFALDVRGDNLRVASTLNTWRWIADEPMVSQVTVFQPLMGLLVPTGSVGGIAPTERIWSVRFTDERAYVVTYRNMDPLWVIDLSSDMPAILGELEIPGVSTYLHPLDDGALLAIGYGPAGEDGFGIDRSSVQVSLFDLSDLSNPRRADVVDLVPPDANGGSAAINEHKAFTYWPEIGRLAVPISSWSGYNRAPESALQFVSVDRAKMTLDLSGQVNQTQLPVTDAWYDEGIQRSFFLGYPPLGPVSVYSVSPRGVTAHDLATLEPQGSVAFETTQPRYYAID